MSNTKVIIGTRGSKLALWQANYTQQILSKHNIEAEIKIIQTKGDASQTWNTSFDKLEGKGFFTKELEEALLNNDIDLAVHSCKDLPTVFPDGLTISAYSKRANPFDVLLINKEKVDVTLPLKLKTDAIVGTSSSRRKAQLLSYRKDITIKDIRGNVPTRISKLENGEFDAILLAQAGIDRLEIDISKFEIVPLEAPMFIPAAAQGILAYQIRENDERMRQLTTCLHDENDAEISTLERKILNAFDGGCQVPLAIYVKKEADWNHVWISLAQSWNGMPFRTHTQYKNLKDVDVSALVQQIRNPKPKKVFITSNLS
ncbi:MAG TPA: hydroxymethylbilane synthase, partial [Chitinophagales bacterium]|nr:hydroxymethylbilane synthase [Chitinophagales bacterium]